MGNSHPRNVKQRRSLVLDCAGSLHDLVGGARMVFVLLLCCGAMIPADEPARSDGKPAAPDLAAYHEAATRAGRDANAQVKLALWCEAHGLSAERIKHLALATLSDPGNAAARGLLGLVRYQGKWQRPED